MDSARFMWAFKTWGHNEQPVVLYDFQFMFDVCIERFLNIECKCVQGSGGYGVPVKKKGGGDNY